MKGIYLGAAKSFHPSHNIVYQDIDGKRDIAGDMASIDILGYDYVIATPPCNYWSKARGKRCSSYSIETRYLLPLMIYKLANYDKPFIVENVQNKKRFDEYGLLNNLPNNVFVYKIGRHTYWTNIKMKDIHLIEQRQDFKTHGEVIKYQDMDNLYHQGGYNVHNVIEHWLKTIGA